MSTRAYIADQVSARELRSPRFHFRVFHCPRCLHEGPLNVEIRPESELEDVHLSGGK